MNVPNRFMNMVLDIHYAWSEDEKVWFISERLNYLCCADIEKKEISVVCKLPHILAAGWCEYIQVIKYQNKFILLPRVVHNILVYNIETHVINTISIKECVNINAVWCKSAGIVRDKLYITEQLSNQIIVFNLEEETISEIIKIKCIDEGEMIGGQSTIYNNHLYIPVVTKEKVISFDIDTYRFEEHFINGEISGCCAVCHDDKYCWIIGGQYGIVRWNPVTGDVFEVGDIPEEFKIYVIDNTSKEVNWYPYLERRKLYDLYDSFLCYENFYDGKYIWLIPEKSDSIMRINADTMQVSIVRFGSEIKKEDFGYTGLNYEFSTWGVDENKNLRIISRQDFKIYCIDTENLSYKIEKWDMADKAAEILIGSLWDEKIREGRWFILDDLIYSEQSEFLKPKDVKYNCEIGSSIHKLLAFEDESRLL